MRSKHLIIVLILLVLTLPAAPAHAGGVVSACNETALKAALAGGGTVTFSCSGTITLTSTITIAADTTIDGSGQNVTISGNNAVRVFYNPGRSLTLKKLTIANGNAPESAGAGIDNDGGTLTVTNSTFSGNQAISQGGGGQGGAIFNHNHGTGTVTNSTFSGNRADSGGAIWDNGYATLTVSSSTFSGNSATHDGGAILGYGTVSNSTFSGNSAGNGGAVYGGATLINCTLSNNSAFYGGAIAIPGNWGPPTLKNTLVASNTGGNCSGTITNGGGNLSYGDSTCPGINGDPKLGPLQNNGGATQTMALLPGSAAVDAADDAICAAAPVNNLDQRSVARPQGAHCDIGAFEATPQAATCTVTSAADDGTTAGTLRVLLANAGCTTINFNNNYTINLQSTLTIGHGVTIDGAGHTVVISGNHAVRVFTVNPGVTLNLNKLTVANGNAGVGEGGGIFNSGTLNVTNSTVSGSSAKVGGGIYNDHGTLTVSNSTFSGNGSSDTAHGGGIDNWGTLTVINSTFSGNQVGYQGGGIWTFGGTLAVINSTFSGNSAVSDGGGIFNYGGGGTATLKNTIVANSPAGGNCGGVGFVDGGGNLSSDADCPASIRKDPVLGPLQDNGGPTQTMALLPGSAALDAANDAICAAAPVNNLDQRGVARPQGAHCDIGAFEATPQATTCTVTSAADDGTTAGTLRVLLANAGCTTIDFNNNYTINLNSTLTIDRDVTIDGVGHIVTISGGDAHQVFFVLSGVTLNLNKLTIAHGNAGEGGGIRNDGTLTVSNSTFSGNSVSNQGGGIYNNTSGTLTVSNSTFSGNQSNNRGGAIANLGTLTVSNSTFFGNSASIYGGGILNNGGTVTLKNTLVANSPLGGNCYGTIINGGGNLSYGDASCPGINGDPKLGPLQDNGGPTQTMALGAGSAARDAAVDAICAAPPVNNLDQRGVARPQGAHCDIGAYEGNATGSLKVYLPLIRK